MAAPRADGAYPRVNIVDRPGDRVARWRIGPPPPNLPDSFLRYTGLSVA